MFNFSAFIIVGGSIIIVELLSSSYLFRTVAITLQVVYQLSIYTLRLFSFSIILLLQKTMLSSVWLCLSTKKLSMLDTAI